MVWHSGDVITKRNPYYNYNFNRNRTLPKTYSFIVNLYPDPNTFLTRTIPSTLTPSHEIRQVKIFLHVALSLTNS